MMKQARVRALVVSAGVMSAALSSETAMGEEGAGAGGPEPSTEPGGEPAPPTVTGTVTLGLLPYTIAGGAFGIGTAASLDTYAEDASVGFGPFASFGATSWLTLGAATPFASAPVEDERVTGLGNVAFSAQFGFFDSKESGITLSATPGVALPSPSSAASHDVTPDMKVSGAVNLRVVAVALTARGAVGVTTDQPKTEAAPAFDSVLSLILVNDTIAPFLEGAVGVREEAVLPSGAAGLNWAPGAGALLTVSVPVTLIEETVRPGMVASIYFETSLLGGGSDVAGAQTTAVAAAKR